MTKADIIKLGQRQIETLKTAVLGKRVTAEKFKAVCSVTAAEQEPDESEKGTLSLEKEKEPRPVDAFVYAGYRRAAVDQVGAFLTYGIYIRLLHHFVDEKGDVPDDKDQFDAVSAALAACMSERTEIYKAEMCAEPEAICSDLCGYMDAMNTRDFFWITTGYGEGDEMHPYFTAFLDVWSIIQDGTRALAAALEEKGRADEREAFAARIDQSIRQAAFRLVGEPPEGIDAYGGDYHFRFGKRPDPLDDAPPPEEMPTAQEAFEDNAAILDALSGQLTFFDGEPFEPKPIPAASLSDEAKRAAGLKLQGAPAELIKAAGRHLDGVLYPIDKVNNNVWRMLEKDTGRQIHFHVESEKSTKEALVLYSIDFSELADISISKKLDAYDKLIYTIVGALFAAGNECVTYRSIYRAMGYNGAPGVRDLENIEKSLKKMRGAQIYVDNTSEAEAQKHRLKFTYNGSLLPWEAIRAEINGKLLDAVIKPLREPPLLTFARERKQVITIPVKALAAPVSKTEQTLAIQDYLIERVAMARKSGSGKILYATIFEKAEIRDKKQRQRAKPKIEKILQQFQSAGVIRSFITGADGVTVTA